MNNPVPVKAIVTVAVRTMSGEGKELNTSWRIAQNSDSPKICARVRNPPASMIGKRYRNPSERYGFVNQSATAIDNIRIAAMPRQFVRFLGE